MNDVTPDHSVQDRLDGARRDPETRADPALRPPGPAEGEDGGNLVVLEPRVPAPLAPGGPAVPEGVADVLPVGLVAEVREGVVRRVVVRVAADRPGRRGSPERQQHDLVDVEPELPAVPVQGEPQAVAAAPGRVRPKPAPRPSGFRPHRPVGAGTVVGELRDGPVDGLATLRAVARAFGCCYVGGWQVDLRMPGG